MRRQRYSSSLPEPLDERAARRLVPLQGCLKERTADFFRRGNRVYVEASWPIDKRGRPKVGIGRFRYPIGYPLNSREACTGHSTHFNAPFVSDNKRHYPIRNEETFNELCAACESLLVDVLACHTIPRWGAYGLLPLVPNPDGDTGDEAVRPLLAQLAKRGALPVLNWREATKLALKGKKQTKEAVARHLARRLGSTEAKRYRFVVPATTWERSTVHPTLSLLCSRSEKQLDLRAHPDIVRLLADCDTTGFADVFVTFDEKDVFDRVIGEGNKYFAKIADPGREFSEPIIARAYLDLINLTLGNGACDKDKEGQLFEALSVPDNRAQPIPLRNLWSSAHLPIDVPGLNLPPILHPDLVALPLFRREKWKRRKFTMAKFLESGVLQDADQETRMRFWRWLRQNAKHVPRAARPKLADLAIWPDENGRLCRITDLCEPRSRSVGAVLADYIRRPHEQVRRSKLVSFRVKARTSIRRTPTESEIEDWLNTRIGRFEIGSKPDAAAAGELGRFEADLALLLKDKAVARLLKAAGVTLPALAKDGSVQSRAALVLPNQRIDRLALPKRYLLKNRKYAAVLYKLSPTPSGPTAAMLLDAFAEDPENELSLHPRLQHFLDVTDAGGDERLKLSETPILPVNGKLHAPSELVLTGNKGDYWGGWKIAISGTGLSQDDQERYRKAGVTSADPKPETSRAFFEWLSTQDQHTLQQHRPCVLRHILHRSGPVRWAEDFPDTPIIPVRNRDSVRLASLREARTERGGRVFLPDAAEIQEEILHRDERISLAVTEAPKVARPISEQLRIFGVRSLRKALAEPESVYGSGNIGPAPDEIRARLDVVRNRRFRETFRQRLDRLEVDAGLVRNDWHNRVSKIEKIYIADEVKARHRFLRRMYVTDVDAGFDRNSGIFWIRTKQIDDFGSVYTAIARQLVFTAEARPVELLALEEAINMDFSQQNISWLGGAETESDSDEGTADSGPGEAPSSGHSPFVPDAGRNFPQPTPVPTTPPRTVYRAADKGKGSKPEPDVNNTEPVSALEREQIEALKRTHYADHCQICLCERPPQELAPVGSYIEWAEIRRHVIEAHHVDLKAARGARHAGNLIILCKFHHDNFGKRLTRPDITASLRSEAAEKLVRFGRDSEVKGRQIELKISDTHEIVRIFFTKEHVDYWLSEAQPTSGSVCAHSKRPATETATAASHLGGA